MKRRRRGSFLHKPSAPGPDLPRYFLCPEITNRPCQQRQFPWRCWWLQPCGTPSSVPISYQQHLYLNKIARVVSLGFPIGNRPLPLPFQRDVAEGVTSTGHFHWHPLTWTGFSHMCSGFEEKKYCLGLESGWLYAWGEWKNHHTFFFIYTCSIFKILLWIYTDFQLLDHLDF